ncbi:MAG: PAS domain S-box protein [Chloroflexi bacterium]|nr:PAS domain S-box protein [Chloroflexota bacterium]
MSGPLHVLLLSHRPDTPAQLEAELRRAGYAPTIELASNKIEFLRALDLPADVILAEAGVPRFPLHEVLRLLQVKGHEAPLLALADPGDEPVGVEALRQGASDYLLTDRLARLGPAVAAALERRRLEQGHLQAEAQPIQAEPLFLSWFENSPFGLSLTNLDGTLLKANAALLRMCGYGSGALPRLRNIARLFEPPDAIHRILHGLKGGQPSNHSTQHLRQVDKGTREALVTAVTIRMDDDDRVLWTVEDVADWVQAERSLQESRAELAEVFGAALDGILTLDEGQRILFLNPAGERIFGLEAGDLVGRPVSDVLRLDELIPEPYGGAPHHAEPRPDWLPTGAAVLRARRAHEHDFPAEVMISRFRFRGTERYVVLVRDITERKAAEDALRESEANYRGIFEGVQDAIMVQGEQGEILDANQQACEMFGYSRPQLLARTVRDLVPADREPIPMEELLGTTQAGRLFEGTELRADGQLFPVQLSARAQTDTIPLACTARSPAWSKGLGSRRSRIGRSSPPILPCCPWPATRWPTGCAPR